ncbi:DUF2156 domain-containing protein [Nitratidesulfovibrio vulgaris]|jgi:hypothetical protein|uniref:Phosphatidylglycerol lysyltransferase C-terminal domain-containing protein n=1 Tax=Nitratidesulfovibrio vulgaris (strain ATCC 29579 / DSM 644 / CCUG 34227 / NCIMB 8303 / VKM B-1760 / Hildenborough) TaxID=882 RepID=Q728P9_NITV2|nr:phosphatidylglycerol lysyltransferase domain-containing protein [Nitratidesulfovibrio vulgaris]AAS97026.1 conserved hypothetical protein [Nitratidesulfovibrio vulgaris str. Hildenborough]ADP87499.1 hypothetical protein Deval_2355 [Nitratidesulfovibrio vulgaris RCH1]
MSATDFSPVTLDAMQDYLALFARTPRRASDYSFTNLWGWAEHYGLEWRFEHGLCWLRQTLPEVRYWAPVGPWGDIDWASCTCLGKGMEFIRVPEELASLWREVLGDRVTVQETPGQWDYLYDSADLADLKGNRFHRKKNHVNGYAKAYGIDYHPLTPDCIEAVIEMQEEWCQWRECAESESLLAENEAVIRVLEEWDSIPGLVGGALYAEGRMVAYTVGEALDDETLVVHFEKGRGDYRGVYQAINQQFVQYEGARFRLVNREQDLDDEGLRKAKQSYYPVDYLRKATVRIAPV